MPEGRRPKGVIPHPRSGAAAEPGQCQAAMAHEQPRGDTPRPRLGRQPGGATLRLRSGAMGEKAF